MNYQQGVKDGAKLTRFYIVIAMLALVGILGVFYIFLQWQSGIICEATEEFRLKTQVQFL